MLRRKTRERGRRRRMVTAKRPRPLWALLLVLTFLFSSTITAAFRPGSLPRLAGRDYARIAEVETITAITDAGPIIDFHQSSSLLAKILIPRVPDTPENAKVRATLMAPFQGKNSKWDIQEHTFTASTPEGEKRMTNVIVTLNVHAPRKLVLAAHHDSKVSPRGFVGATDSAVPCAIIVDTALALEKMLEQQGDGGGQSERAQETGLQLIFFDGEEAYHQWTDSDSVYGSRALAADWAKTFFSPQIAKRRNTPGYATMRTIDSIDQFVLLDLLGTPHPVIPAHFMATKWMHDELRDIERRLASSGLLYPKDTSGRLQLPPAGGYGTAKLPAAPGTSEQRASFFSTGPAGQSGVDDDHRPFMQNGVPILHLIPLPFPSVWHRMSDNADSLDYPTIYAWAMIMRVFIAEYFDVKLPSKPSLLGRDESDFVSDWHARALLNNTTL